MVAMTAPEPAAAVAARPVMSRAAVLKGFVGATAAAAAVGMAAAGAPAWAVEEAMMVNYESPSKVFSFDYPDSWVLAPKPLQTHQEEVRGLVCFACLA